MAACIRKFTQGGIIYYEKIEEAIKSADTNDIRIAEFVYKAISTAERILDNGEA